MNRVIARLPMTEIAIIGFWRSGASFQEISEITDKPVSLIQLLVLEYAERHNLTLEVSENGKLIWK